VDYEKYKELTDKYKQRPDLFVEDYLGVSLNAWQKSYLRLMMKIKERNNEKIRKKDL
jgi:hypothetical protein